MIYGELTQVAKQRFRNSHICPICENEVSMLEQFEVVRYKNERKLIQYSFIHTACLCNARNKERGLKYAEAKQNLGSVYGKLAENEWVDPGLKEKEG